MPDFPETPEGVALVLFMLVLAEARAPEDRSRECWMLDLFALCLRAAEGERPTDKKRSH
jgi:hypothetical protein